MAVMAFALTLAAAACAGAPQYGTAANEPDSGIFAADRPTPDSVVPVIAIHEAGAMAAAQNSRAQRAIERPALHEQAVPP
jgi:hypothetical protein